MKSGTLPCATLGFLARFVARGGETTEVTAHKSKALTPKQIEGVVA